MPTRAHRLVESMTILVDGLLDSPELGEHDIKMRDRIEDDLVELGADREHMVSAELENKLARVDARIRKFFDDMMTEEGDVVAFRHWDAWGVKKGIPISRWWWYPFSSRLWARSMQLVEVDKPLPPGSFGLTLTDHQLWVPKELHAVLVDNGVTAAMDVYELLKRGRTFLIRHFGWQESDYAAAMREAKALLPAHLKLEATYLVRTGALLPDDR